MVESMPIGNGERLDCDSGNVITRRRAPYKSAQDALEAYITAYLTASSVGSRQGAQADRLTDGAVVAGEFSQPVTLGRCSAGCDRWTELPTCPRCGAVVHFPSRAVVMGNKAPRTTHRSSRAMPRGYDDIGTLAMCWGALSDSDRMLLVLDVTVSQWQDSARRCVLCGTVYAPIEMRCKHCHEGFDASHVRCPRCREPLEAQWAHCPVDGHAVWSKVTSRMDRIADEMTAYRVRRHEGRKSQQANRYTRLRLVVKASSIPGMLSWAHRAWASELKRSGLI